MCDRCGDDSCEGRGTFGVVAGNLDPDTGKFTPLPYAADTTAAHDQICMSLKSMCKNVYEYWDVNRRNANCTDNFEAFSNMMLLVSHEIPPAVRHNLLTYCLITLGELGHYDDDNLAGIDLTGTAEPEHEQPKPTRRCLHCDRPLRAKEHCACQK